MENLKPGIYQHYKGGEYELLFVAEQTEDHSELAVYRSLKDNHLWARPSKMWAEDVLVDGQKRPRFIWLEEARPRYPEAVAVPLIYNDKQEIFLIKNPKCRQQWTIPGGHIEWGEKIVDALVREVAEETSLRIDQIEFISATDGIKPKNFLKVKHFVFLNFFAHLAGGEPSLSDEMTEYLWISPEKAVRELDLSDSIKDLLAAFIARKIKGADTGDWEGKYKRALADYQNLLKQTAKDKEEFVKFAISDFLQEILPVYDHLKMSLTGLPEAEQESAWVKGVEYVLKQFKDILAARGVTDIKTIGEKFDHNLMEAMDGSGETVIKEVMPGYTLNGRVIRAAKVIVGE